MVYSLHESCSFGIYRTKEEMDTGNDRNNLPVLQPTLPLEALLSESKQLQAISWQLIRESRELRMISMLLQHSYRNHHIHLEKYPHLIIKLIPEQ